LALIKVLSLSFDNPKEGKIPLFLSQPLEFFVCLYNENFPFLIKISSSFLSKFSLHFIKIKIDIDMT